MDDKTFSGVMRGKRFRKSWNHWVLIEDGGITFDCDHPHDDSWFLEYDGFGEATGNRLTECWARTFVDEMEGYDEYFEDVCHFDEVSAVRCFFDGDTMRASKVELGLADARTLYWLFVQRSK